MRMLVFFDLPVTTKAEPRCASQFRKFLLDDGYYMVQFSVYARLCSNMESAVGHEKKLRAVAPKNGSIRVMIVTEKQYADMHVLCGEKKIDEEEVECYQLSFF